MKHFILTSFLLIFAQLTFAENTTKQSPITMEQLMRELRIKGGNWVFTFDEPVYAKVVFTVSRSPEGKTQEITEFISDRPTSTIELFFMASADRIGEYAKPNQENYSEMKIKLSDCVSTDGTRVIHYLAKFSQNPWIGDGQGLGEFSPSVPLNPELNKEYILHYYFKRGDSYEAKATVCFLKKPEDAANVEKFDRDGARRFKQADEIK